MDIQSIISSGLTDIVTALAAVLAGLLVAYIKQHFSAKQIATAGSIATEAVKFVAQTTKNLNVQDATKFKHALDKAKDLAAKAGIKLSDSQWETMIESSYKSVKDELESLVTAATPYTQDEIINMVKDEVKKAIPGVPTDTIEEIVKKQLGNLNVSVSVAKQVAGTDLKPIAIPNSITIQPEQQTA